MPHADSDRLDGNDRAEPRCAAPLACTDRRAAAKGRSRHAVVCEAPATGEDHAALAAFVSSAESRQSTNSAVLNAYAAAFTRYRDSVQLVLDKLEQLNAPPVLHPTLVAERKTLGRTATLSGSVAAALHRKDVSAANKAIKQLFASAAAAGQASTQRAAAAAAAAYNARLHRISVLTGNIARERQQLVKKLG